MGDRAEGYRQAWRALRRGAEKDAVHDFRVASRRLLAALELVSAATAGSSLAKATRRRVKARFVKLSQARDLEVEHALIETFLPQRPELATVADWLARRHRRAARQVGRLLPSPLFGHIGHEARGFTKALTRELLAVSPTALAARLHGALEGRLGKASTALDALHVGRPETFHALRIRLKKVRYAFEGMAAIGAGDAPFDRALKGCRQLQDRLGHIQDLDVLAADVDRRARSHADLAVAAATIASTRDGAMRAFFRIRGRVASLLAELWELSPATVERRPPAPADRRRARPARTRAMNSRPRRFPSSGAKA